MARRVKQADGSYCYTENCRIHDRSGDSTGLQAVINDSNFRRVEKFTSTVSEVLQTELGAPKETADRIGARVTDVTLNSGSGVTIHAIAEAAEAEGLPVSLSDVQPATFAIHNRLSRLGTAQIGDEVILVETGERGVISEGDSSFGGPVRFNPENLNSPNSFRWVKSEAVMKLVSDENSLAREQIFSMSRDSLVRPTFVKQMLDEETDTATRNAQGVKGLGENTAEVRNNILGLGDEIVARWKDRGMSKRQILKFLTGEHERLDENTGAEVAATKSALRNIITYLSPVENKK